MIDYDDYQKPGKQVQKGRKDQKLSNNIKRFDIKDYEFYVDDLDKFERFKNLKVRR